MFCFKDGVDYYYLDIANSCEYCESQDICNAFNCVDESDEDDSDKGI